MILTHGANSISRETAYIGVVEYKIVRIGTQVWMAENLNFINNGIALGLSGAQTTDPAAWYVNNDEATYGLNGKRYGLLYNAPAVQYLQTNRAQFFPGWHVPSLDELNTLVNYCGGSTNAGEHLKSDSADWINNGQGDNSSGFSILPTGNTVNGTTFSGIGTFAYLYTRTQSSKPGCDFKRFNVGNIVYSSQSVPNAAMSVRLLKD